MQSTLRSSRPLSVRAAVVAVATLTAGLLVAFAAPASADPTNPSDAQISAAQAAKTALATQVGTLTAQLTSMQNQVAALQAKAELAEQKVALAQQQLQEAQDAAVTTKADVATAQATVDAARTSFDASVRASYIDGSLQNPGGALLTSTDPDAMLQTQAMQAYVSSHQVDAIGRLDRATVAKANADAAARAAVTRQTQLAAAAQQAMRDARSAEASAQAQEQTLATQQAAVRTQLDTAQAALLGLQNQRAAFVAWQAEQARIAAAAEAARQAALLAQQAAQSPSSGGDGNNGGNAGSGGTQSSGNPSGGSWTAARGQDAVNRAMAYKGMRYSYAAGNFNGPTYGVCGSGDAGNNDCHVFGFDCSGLALYAWAPYLHMDHYAATQYGQAGSFHPGIGSLLPGDLVFWSSDGTRWGIHHVAIYIGGGNVIQAPQSGELIKITNLFNVDSGYYGATRPLT